jgi:hypothetical protein
MLISKKGEDIRSFLLDAGRGKSKYLFTIGFTIIGGKMKAKRILLAAASFLVPILLLGLASCVAVPSLPADYSHQGRLTTGTGAPVADGNYTIRYQLFHVATGGTALYTETKTVPVKGGLFDTSIGLTGAIPPDVFAQPTWMEIKVKNEVLSPRQQLMGAPYASSLVGGAVVQGHIPITRTFGGFDNTGANLTVWNQDSSEKGGNGLIAFNSASATSADRDRTAAIQAHALDADSTASTGGLGAIIVSDNYRGMDVQSGTNWFAAVFHSNAGIEIVGGGSCSGCTTAYFAMNVGTDTIQPGEFVAAVGVTVDPDLNVPVMQVRKAANASDPIIGVAAGSLERTPVEDYQGMKTGGFDQLGSSAEAGKYLSVAVQGLVQVRVETGSALKIGDRIGVNNSQVTLAAGEIPSVARLMSAVDENGMAWIMFNGQ